MIGCNVGVAKIVGVNVGSDVGVVVRVAVTVAVGARTVVLVSVLFAIGVNRFSIVTERSARVGPVSSMSVRTKNPPHSSNSTLVMLIHADPG